MNAWPNLSELLIDEGAEVPIGLVGAPLAAGSVTPVTATRRLRSFARR